MKPRHRLAALPALGLAAALAVPALAAVPAVAESGQRKVVEVTELQDARTRDQLLSGEGTRVVDPSDTTSATSTLKSDGSVKALADTPSSFDLRACDLDGDGTLENYITGVRNQNPFGTCWSFGSTAAAEASLLAELRAGVPVDEVNDNLNLSEKALVWFVKNPQPEDSLQPEEGIHTASEDPVSKFNGGFISTATSSYAMGNGPIDESLDPVLEYHNNAPTLEEQYDIYDLPADKAEEAGLNLNHFMLAKGTGDWSVPEEWRGLQNWELEETYYLPSPASFEDTDTPGVQRYVTNEAGIEAIRQQLLQGRAVGIGFCADTSQPGQENVPHYMRQDTYAHYTYENPNEGPGVGGAANHAVCIVGYDDTYPKENFYAEHQPPADGAFIVKNSWGSNGYDERNFAPWGIDGSGYFYLSYYDKSISMPEAFDFITVNDTDSSLAGKGVQGAYLYQYAFLPNDPTGTNHDATTSFANVYTMRTDSVIRDVATQTFSLGTHVRFDIFLMDEGATEPSDGTLLWTHEETFPYGGYHRVELDKTLQLKAGDKVGVVCTSQLPNGEYEVVNNQNSSKFSYDHQYADQSQGGYWNEATVNPGDSFIGSPSELVTLDDGSTAYDGYTWVDYSEVIAKNAEEAQKAYDATDLAELKQARDDAYATLSALSPDDPAYAEANAALDAAQTALEDTISPIFDTTLRGIMYTQDNFPLNITTAPVSVDMYRLYNPYSTEHLYTTDAAEKDALVEAGWNDEGIGWQAPATSRTPIRRLYNPNTGEHLYTADGNEVRTLDDTGWVDEGVKFYGSDAPVTPVYRLRNPFEDGVGAHHYTTDEAERDQLLELGWHDEDIAWYGL